MPPLTKDEIRERLQTVNVYITAARTAFFAAVDERKIRFVVAITLFGDRTSTREVYIEKLKEDGNYEPVFDSINLAAPEKVQLPIEGKNIENPIITLEGGTRLYGRVSGNSINATCEYWDNDV